MEKESLVSFKYALKEFSSDSVFLSGIIYLCKNNISDVKELTFPINTPAATVYRLLSFREDLQSKNCLSRTKCRRSETCTFLQTLASSSIVFIFLGTQMVQTFAESHKHFPAFKCEENRRWNCTSQTKPEAISERSSMRSCVLVISDEHINRDAYVPLDLISLLSYSLQHFHWN